MAESEAKQPLPTETVEENANKELQYLDFVQGATIYVIVCFSTLYEYAKENSGSLKPGVQTVEGTVRTVIGPVYEKFHDVPLDFLKFMDHKVGDAINELDRHVPTVVRQASYQLLSVAKKAPELAQELASEVNRAGFFDAAKTMYTNYEPIAKELYVKYEPVVEQYAVLAWTALNKLPLFPQVAHILVPTATHWAEWYNQAVAYAVERGYMASYCLPLIPVERIAKVFENPGYGDGAVYTNESVVLAQ